MHTLMVVLPLLLTIYDSAIHKHTGMHTIRFISVIIISLELAVVCGHNSIIIMIIIII